MKIQLTPDTKLKKPLDLIWNGTPVKLFHHEKGASECVVDMPNGKSEVVALNDLELVGKQRNPLTKTKKPLTPEEALEKKVLNAFFNVMADLVPFKCMNCRKELFALSKETLRAVTCHILPKKDAQFPELATDPDNIVFMGVLQFGSECGCHTKFDYSVDNRIKMPIYPLVIKRYHEKIKHKLSPDKQILAEEYLGIRSKSQNLAHDLQAEREGVKV